MIVLCAQVRGYIYDREAAGGYQIYGCLGTSYLQARPLHVGLYGLPHEQARFTPVTFHFHFVIFKRGFRPTQGTHPGPD